MTSARTTVLECRFKLESKLERGKKFYKWPKKKKILKEKNQPRTRETVCFKTTRRVLTKTIV